MTKAIACVQSRIAMIVLASICTVSLLAWCDALADDAGAGKTDQQAIQGNWKAVAWWDNGEDTTDRLPDNPITATFDGDKCTIGKDHPAKFSLDERRTPHRMHIEAAGDQEEQFVIYELKGDKLKIAANNRPTTYPSDFKPEHGKSLTLDRQK